MFRLFIAPLVVSSIAFLAVGIWGGAGALLLTFFLTLLEVSLSFDNAVINAKVLSRMDEKWQQRFLTWGMLIAVVGARLVLPLIVVSIAAGVAPFAIAFMVFADPTQYADLVARVSPSIHAFGGAFLLMVALRYFFDEAKEVHWIHFVEKRMIVWGRVQAIEVMFTLIAILLCAWATPGSSSMILAAGIIGIVLFIIIEGIVETLAVSNATVGSVGAGLFLYLNLLDAAFSLDGVVGAFALTSQILIIIVGLGIGAYFVRTLTIFFVRKRTLATLKYLEHGAYWAIFALALCMFITILQDVPDALVGTISILFIGAAYFSSLRAQGLPKAENY